MTADTMDPRCSFLRTTSDSLPLDVSFAFEPVEKRGTLAMHYWPARRGTDRPPDNLIYFILGNPGVLDYYTPYLDHLHARLPDSHAILCTSHVGGDMRLAGPAEPLDLPQHVECKVECAKALRGALDAWAAETGELAPPKLSLMGHSIGSWICSHVMKEVKVHSAYFLFPTLGWIANSWNGWTMWPMFHRPVRPLLPYLAKLLVPVIPYLPLNLPPTSLRFVQSPDTLRHVLHMARSEMLLVRQPDLEFYYAQRERPAGTGVHGVWSAGSLDGWVGKDGPLVQECLGPKRVVQLEGVPHSFCIHEKDWLQVADIVSDWVHEHLPNGTMPNGTMPNGTMPNGTMPNGTMPNGRL